MSKSAVWLCYDLGVDGDYRALFRWLDAHKARECGEGLAFLVYEYSVSLPKELAPELRQAVGLRNSDRIYAVYQDESTQQLSGKFLIGLRRTAPWAGHAATSDTHDSDTA